MRMLEAKRTLVKSGPELWAEVSDPEALAGHLAPFGEIRITRTADNSLVEWEGERATGRLELEPSGFGTRVVLQAELVAPEPVAPPEPPPAPEPEPVRAPEPPPAPVVVAPPPPPARQGFFAKLFGRKPAPAPVPVAVAPPPPPAPEPAFVAPPAPPAPPVPAPEPLMPDEAVVGVLTDVLDHLGTAHHRPFSRS
jgi:hypothetical protein